MHCVFMHVPTMNFIFVNTRGADQQIGFLNILVVSGDWRNTID